MSMLTNLESAAQATLQAMDFHHNLNVVRRAANSMSEAALKLDAIYKQSPQTLQHCFPSEQERERLFEILEMSEVLTKLATSLSIDFHAHIASGIQRGMIVAHGALKRELRKGAPNA